ncbi:MAG: lamin tail domain-containing protein [Rudaea sp.]|nr:lamin tail domain-containing protein [Rudaea sp.]
MHKYTGIFLTGLLLAASASAAQAQVVISQVYGGGNNSGATYQNDFIELFNAGSSAQSLNGLSVQYASSAGSTWNNLTALSDVTLQPGQYYLIQESGGTTNGIALPTPDLIASTPINLSGTNGKVALVSGTAAITTGTSCPSGSTILDFVGYGNANCANPTAALSNSTAAIRDGGGCTNTDTNSADFTLATPTPRNSASPANICSGSGGHTDPTGVGAATPNALQAGGTTVLTLTVTPGTDPPSSAIAVTADLSAIGGSSTQTFYDDGATGDDATANDNVFTYTAAVGANTSAGIKSLPATIADGQGGSGTATISLTVNSPPVTIMSVQGHGSASPLNGQNVTTMGNVVTAVGPKGFFMQDPVGDGDPTTSDGIYVYLGAAPAVAVGNEVTVSGQVQEFSGSTEIANHPTVTVTNPAAPTMPAAYVLDSNPPTTDPTTGICMGPGSTIAPATDGYQASNFACLDGMLVTMSDAVVTGPTYGNSVTDGVHTGTPTGFYATLASQPRPLRAPGALYPGLGGSIPVWNGEPEVIDIYYAGLGFNPGTDDGSATDFVYQAGTRFSLTGVIQGYQATGTTSPIYEVYPASLTTNVRMQPSDDLKPVSDSAPGTLTIGSQNMLHFFNATADGVENNGAYDDTCAGTGANDQCPTPAQYQIRLSKMSRQLCDALKAPAVLDLEEVENYSTLTDLKNAVFSQCGVTYQPYTIPGNDVSGINIGLLVRNDVTVNSVTQLYLNTMTSNCSSGTSCLLNDRPPLLLDANYLGYHFALLAIYNRSLSGLGSAAKPYIGPKRAEEAAQVAAIVNAWQTGGILVGAADAQQDANGNITTGSSNLEGDATVPLIVAGDFNAYEFSDGYADVTGMILGTALQSQNLYWYAGNAADTDTPGYTAPAPTLVDSGIKSVADSRYSYNFSGYAQEIDHILLTRLAWTDFASISNAHGNSDVSEASGVILDGSTAVRTSDHDGQVLTLAIDRVFADGFDAQP